jgi:hypothetical protein
MAFKTDPSCLKLKDRLYSWIDRTPGMERIPFNSASPLPGTVRPDCTSRASYAEQYAEPRWNHRHICTSHLFHDFEDCAAIRKTLAEMVDGLRDFCRAERLEMFDAPPLPHAPELAHLYYTPVIIDGGHARVIMSYSHVNQGWLLTIDAYARPLPNV